MRSGAVIWVCFVAALTFVLSLHSCGKSAAVSQRHLAVTPEPTTLLGEDESRPHPPPAENLWLRLLHLPWGEHISPKEGEIAPSSQALRPTLQAPKGTGGSSPSHRVGKNKRCG